MPVTLSVGTTNLEVDNLADLENAASTVFTLGQAAFAGNLDKPVAQYPDKTAASLKYTSGNNTWTVGNFTFGLAGAVNGSVTLLGPGDILSTYTTAFATTVGDALTTATNTNTTGSIVVPYGDYYIQVSLDLQLNATGAAAVPLGAVGIQGSATASDTFAVTFSKKVAGTMALSDALIAAFQGFVLPLHPATYTHLQPGDYLFHQFNATLNLGFGASYGLDKVCFSGQYKADIPGGPAALSINTAAQAEIKAGATMSATFRYSGSFEALLWKTDANTGQLHLYKSKVDDASFNFGGTATVIANPAVTVNPVNLQALVTQVLPGETGTLVSQLLSGKAQSEVNGWIADVQSRLTSWLKPFQQGTTQLQLAIDNTASRYVLLDFAFDLTAPAFPAAWSHAIAGDFCAALAVPGGGATLNPGSGLEYFHTRKTSVAFNLFGHFNAEWTAANINNYSVLYAGNNKFNLVQNIGRTQIATLNKGSHEIDFYFAAVATSGPTGPVAGEVDLHVVLTATHDKTFGLGIAALLAGATTGPAASALSKQVQALAQQGTGTQSLTFLFKPSAYNRLAFSKVNNGNAMANDTADRANFLNFAQACGLLETSAPANFKTTPPMAYDLWSAWNIGANDQFPPPDGSGPNRRDTGNPSAGWACLGQMMGSSEPAALTAYALQAASDFMNLCEDLTKLATLADGNGSWQTLVADLIAIVKNDVAVDFIPATTLALTESLSQAGLLPQVTGPAPNAAGEPAISVTVVYS